MSPVDTIKYSLPAKLDKVKKGVGSFLTFDGILSSEKSLHLWVYLCDWEFFSGDKIVLDSDEADGTKINDVLKSVESLFLNQIFEVSPGTLKLVFDRGYSLIVSMNLDCYDPDDDLVIIYISECPAIGYTFKKHFYFEDNDNI